MVALLALVGSPARQAGRRRWRAWWALAGVAILAAGLWNLIRDREGLNAVWYVPAWYGYLVLLDAAIYGLRGRSFLSHRRRELGAMAFWSVPFWMLFEAYNLRLGNWYYVFGLHSDLLSASNTALCFATVLPACFFHAELIRALGWGQAVRWRPLVVGPRIRVLWLGMGAASIALPLIWPRWAFPLVWGATLWLPDWVNYRRGAPSLVGDLAAGRGDRLLRLLVGGLWAGGVWELFNYWARCKWIYTVPGFEEWKLFEMPLMGFLGFPVLALGAFTFYTLICHLLRGGRSWEKADRQPAAVARWAAAGAGLVAIAFSIAVYLAILGQSVHARRPLLGELEGLGPDAVAGLRAAGLPTPERLFAAAEREGTGGLAARLDLEPTNLERAHRHAALALHKGMGSEMARLLLNAGIATVAELAAVDSESLHQDLTALAQQAGRAPPRRAQVRVWVRAARLGGRPRR